MSNTQVQYLQKQIARKDAQIATLMQAFENVLMENELMGSIACAFAWDLQTKLGNPERWDLDEITLSEVEIFCLARWEAAVKAVGG